MTDPQTEVTVLDLCDLIDWLARPYGLSDPIWPLIHPVTGERMPHNERLARTWYRVVRNSDVPHGLPAPEVPAGEEGATHGKQDN